MLMLMTQMGIRTLLTHNETDPVQFMDVLNRAVYHNVQRMEIDKSLTLALLDYPPTSNGRGAPAGQRPARRAARGAPGGCGRAGGHPRPGFPHWP